MAAGYSWSEIVNYYFDVAFGLETRTRPSDKVRKWKEPIRVYAIDATDYDVAVLTDVISELAALGYPISLVQAEEERNATVRFIQDLVVPNAGGYAIPNFTPWTINTCSVGVEANNPDEYRATTIREELVGCLGLLKDVWTYSDSVFYGEAYPIITEFSPMDLAVLKIHAWSAIQAGMSQDQVRELLSE